MERARLGKNRRLRTASEFARVRQFGRSYATMLLSVSVARQQAMKVLESPQLVAPTRVGFSVGKRVGGAVVRNRVRRRLREIMRARLGQLAPGWDVVVAARPPAAESLYAALDEELQRLLARAKVLAPGSEARHV